MDFDLNKIYHEQYLPIIYQLDKVRKPGESSIDLVNRLVQLECDRLEYDNSLRATRDRLAELSKEKRAK